MWGPREHTARAVTHTCHHPHARPGKPRQQHRLRPCPLYTVHSTRLWHQGSYPVHLDTWVWVGVCVMLCVGGHVCMCGGGGGQVCVCHCVCERVCARLRVLLCVCCQEWVGMCMCVRVARSGWACVRVCYWVLLGRCVCVWLGECYSHDDGRAAWQGVEQAVRGVGQGNQVLERIAGIGLQARAGADAGAGKVRLGGLAENCLRHALPNYLRRALPTQLWGLFPPPPPHPTTYTSSRQAHSAPPPTPSCQVSGPLCHTPHLHVRCQGLLVLVQRGGQHGQGHRCEGVGQVARAAGRWEGGQLGLRGEGRGEH